MSSQTFSAAEAVALAGQDVGRGEAGAAEEECVQPIKPLVYLFHSRTLHNTKMVTTPFDCYTRPSTPDIDATWLC